MNYLRLPGIDFSVSNLPLVVINLIDPFSPSFFISFRLGEGDFFRCVFPSSFGICHVVLLFVSSLLVSYSLDGSWVDCLSVLLDSL